MKLHPNHFTACPFCGRKDGIHVMASNQFTTFACDCGALLNVPAEQGVDLQTRVFRALKVWNTRTPSAEMIEDMFRKEAKR